MIDVPPLVTRPKAATVGVGRQVILRPSLQKRYVELDEPTLEDQRTDLERLRDAMDDLDLRVERGRAAPPPARAAQPPASASRASSSDDLLIDVEPGDTTERLHAIAFDLGTTTVVATLLDLATGTPVAVRSMLNRQQPFGADVITRISATMLDPEALDRLRELACQTMQELAEEVCAQGGVEPGDVYEVALAGNATMTELALGIDPEPVGVAPFIMAARSFPDMPAAELGLAPAPARPRDRVPRPRRLRRRRRRRRPARHRDDARPPPAPLHRRRHQLRDRPRLGRPARLHGGAGGPGVRGRADPLRHARRRRGDRGRAHRRRRARARGHRRTSSLPASAARASSTAVAELVRVGLLDASGRFVTRGAGGGDRARALAPVRRARGRRAGLRAPLEGRRRRRRERRLPLPARRPRAAVRQGRDRDGLEAPRRGARDRRAPRSSRSCSPARSAPTSRPRARCASASCRACRSRVSSPAGNVAGEGAKMALLSMQERHAADAMLEEVEYVELSDRADFNDRFVEQLALPGGAVTARERVLVLACGALAREVLAVVAAERLDARRRALPAGEAASDAGPDRAGGRREAAGPGRLVRARLRRLRRLRHERRARRGARGPRCRAAPRAALLRLLRRPGGAWEALQEEEPGTFYLTDFLARHFEALVLRPLELDRYPELSPTCSATTGGSSSSRRRTMPS